MSVSGEHTFSGVFRKQSNICDGDFLQKVDVDVRQGSKYASDVFATSLTHIPFVPHTLVELGSLIHAEAYSKPSGPYKMEIFAKIAHGFQPLTIFAKTSLLDVRMSSEYVSDVILQSLRIKSL